MADILNFPKSDKRPRELPKDFLIKLLTEDGFNPEIAAAAIDAFNRPWELLMELPAFHIDLKELPFAGISREQLDALYNYIHRQCNEAVNEFAEKMHIVHRKVFYASLQIYARELEDKT